MGSLKKVEILTKVMAKTCTDYELHPLETMAAVTGVFMCVSEEMLVTPEQFKDMLERIYQQYIVLLQNKEQNEKK